MTLLDHELDKVVVYLDPSEFQSTWLGNKAIYRTRMAIKVPCPLSVQLTMKIWQFTRSTVCQG